MHVSRVAPPNTDTDTRTDDQPCPDHTHARPRSQPGSSRTVPIPKSTAECKCCSPN
jgi:hypothetical protein